MIPWPSRDLYSPVASFTLGTIATIRPHHATFLVSKKSLFFVSYGLELLGEMRLTVHTG
jgi:hypothetical protein